MDYRSLSTYHNDDIINVVIEIPKGAYSKYEIDPETGSHLNIVRELSHKGTHKYKYPYNYGFIPSTLADDNDQLDVIVISDEPVDPLTVMQCRVIGVVKTIDKGDRDDKILAVPTYSDLKVVKLNEILKFLHSYKYPDNESTTIGEVLDSVAAIELVNESHLSYVVSRGDEING